MRRQNKSVMPPASMPLGTTTQDCHRFREMQILMANFLHNQPIMRSVDLVAIWSRLTGFSYFARRPLWRIMCGSDPSLPRKATKPVNPRSD